MILVRGDCPLHNILAQPPGSIDQDHLLKAAVWIEREKDSSTANVRTNHALYSNRQGDTDLVEAHGLPVADRPVSEERRIAALAGL